MLLTRTHTPSLTGSSNNEYFLKFRGSSNKDLIKISLEEVVRKWPEKLKQFEENRNSSAFVGCQISKNKLLIKLINVLLVLHIS